MDNLGNPWKLATLGMALVVVTALVTTLVVAGLSRRDAQQAVEVPAAGSASPSMPAGAAVVASAPSPVPQAGVTVPPTSTQPPPASAVPTRATVDACNRYAANRPTKDKTIEVVKDGAIGGAIGAAVGAAGGAIAGGGKGAGTGAAIGGVVGITGGALYGLNENKKHDERYRQAYASCMRSRGHTG